MNNIITDYIDKSDWRVKENSNANYSYSGLQGHIANEVISKYAFSTMYTGDLSRAHKDSFIHIHDSSDSLVGYCAGWSLEDIIKNGFNCGTRYVHSNPAKHLSELLGQLNNFIFTMTGEWAGAQALNSLDTYCASFIKNDNMSYTQVESELESFIYNLNIKTRIAMQSPFSNVSVDLIVPEDLKDRYAIIGGELANFTYGDCQDEITMFNSILAKIMKKGDGAGKIFTFPVVTYSITEDFPWNSQLAQEIFEFADESNTPYFSNFINSNNSPSDVRSMCLTGEALVHVIDSQGISNKIAISQIYNLFNESLSNEDVIFDYKVKSYKEDVSILNVSSFDVSRVIRIRTRLGNYLTSTLEHHHIKVVDLDECSLTTIKAKDLSVGDRLLSIDTNSSTIYTIADEIVEITELNGIFKVYDLELSPTIESDEGHWYYANNLLTHNCCRLRLDLSELQKSSGGLFGSGDKTGSIGVVTLNLSRIAYVSSLLEGYYGSESLSETRLEDAKTAINILLQYDTFKGFIDDINSLNKVQIYYCLLSKFMLIARESLLVKRSVVQKNLDLGLLPYTKKYLGTFKNHFNTIGVNAGHEACLNLLGVGIEDPRGQFLMVNTLNFMLDRLSEYQIEDNGKLLWNLEATPAEGCGTRFARNDRKTFNDIITGAGANSEYYTNSTQLPENYTENIYEVFEHQDKLQPLYTSGTVQHIYMNEPTHNWRAIQYLVKSLFTDYRLPYLSISPDITVCPIHGKLDRYYEYCPLDHNENEIRKLLSQGVISDSDIRYSNID